MKILSDILNKAGILQESSSAYTAGGYSLLVRNSTSGRFETISSEALLPSQAGNAGRFLKTNGTTSSWSNILVADVTGAVSGLTGEVTTTGTGVLNVTLSNLGVINKVLTGLSITSGSIVQTDSILTAFGKLQGQINALSGGSTYRGTWNAATNTPTITSSVGTSGDYYIVSTAGTTNINGINSWDVGDWIIFDGSVWQKVDNTDSVTSVNGQTGAVNLTSANISEATNLYYTDARSRAAISVAGSGTYNSSTGVITINGGVTGSGTAGQVAYFDASNNIVSDNGLNYESSNGRLSIGGTSNSYKLNVLGVPDGTIGQVILATTGRVNVYPYHSAQYGVIFESKNPNDVGSLPITLSGSTVNLLGTPILSSFIGAGTRMVVTDASGTLSTQAIPTSSVVSVFGRTGTVTAQSGDYTTAQVTESGNLYYTDARSRAAISVAGSGSYNPATGVITINGGVTSVNGATGAVTLTTANIGEVTNLYYTDARARAAISVTGSGSYNSTTGVITINGGVTSVNGLTGAVTLTTSNISEGTNLYYTDARARAAISLTTTGSSGASTYSAGVLNIPNYTLAGLGGVGGTVATGQVAFATAANTIGGSNNLFWDAANNRLGIGKSPASPYALDVNGSIQTNSYLASPAVYSLSSLLLGVSGGTLAMAITTNRNIQIFDSTQPADSASHRLQVYGDTLLRGSGNSNTTTALTVQNSSSTNLFTVRNDGLSTFSGIVVAGSATSTQGSVILRGYYTSGYLATIGTDASSGGPMISYAVESAQNSTAGSFVSSTPNVDTPRSAYTVSGSHRWYTAAASTTAVGTSIALTKYMELYNSGNLVLGGGADVVGNRLQVTGNSLFTGTINTGAITATSIQGNGIVRSDAARTAVLNDVSIALLGSNITTYPANFSMLSNGYGLNAVYAQHEQRFGGNATFNSANIVGAGLMLNKLAPTAAGTVTMGQIGSGRTMSNLHLMTQFSGDNNLTVTHMSGLHIYGHYRTSGSGVLTVSTAYYGILLADPNEFGAGATVTGDNWGFYQAGTAPTNYFGGSVLIGTATTDADNKVVVNGSLRASQLRVSAMNTAPATATSAGTLGEVRITADHIYVCTATNTWKRVAIATF